MTASRLSAIRSRLAPLTAMAALALAAVQPASAANISLSGSFARDDGIQLLTLTLTGAGAITASSIGYAGGTLFNGGAVAAGGFDTVMYLFSSTGALLNQSDDGIGVGVDPSTGEALDAAFTTASLAAGVYTLALTQADNYLLGFNLSDGFARAFEGNFTSAFGCSNGSFCDYQGNNRTSSWAINFSGNTLVSVVPEPGSLALALAAGGLLLGLRGRQRDATSTALSAG